MSLISIVRSTLSKRRNWPGQRLESQGKATAPFRARDREGRVAPVIVDDLVDCIGGRDAGDRRSSDNGGVWIAAERELSR